MIEVSTYYSSVSQALGNAYGSIALILCPDLSSAGLNDAASSVKRLRLQRLTATHLN